MYTRLTFPCRQEKQRKSAPAGESDALEKYAKILGSERLATLALKVGPKFTGRAHDGVIRISDKFGNRNEARIMNLFELFV